MLDNINWLLKISFMLNLIKWKLLGLNMPFLGSRSEFPIIHRHVRIRHPSNVMLTRRVILYPYCYIKSAPGKIVIGEYSSIGEYSYINAMEYVEIGSEVLVAPFCHITDANHNIEMVKPIRWQGREAKPTRIGDGVWLGSGVRVLAGVNIGKRAVVGAGAVVAKDIAPYAIAAGVPAKQIGVRH